jgi:hypothetical protein
MNITELYKLASTDAYENGRDFHKDVEEAFEFGYLPASVKSKIHWNAWDDGHSAGYVNVVSCYFDLVDIALAAYDAGKKAV